MERSISALTKPKVRDLQSHPVRMQRRGAGYCGRFDAQRSLVPNSRTNYIIYHSEG